MDSFVIYFIVILGLDRMKTKMRLKREKTEMRKMTSVVEREKKHPDKFMKAAEKVNFSCKALVKIDRHINPHSVVSMVSQT